jgi:glycosyltransferase involved in cell wall biosynthesis
MKILYLNAFSVIHGGAERLLYDTSIELLHRGHQVAMVIANDDQRENNPEIWPAAINRYYVPELILPVHERNSYNKHRRAAPYQTTVRYLQDIIKIESPDVIHVHNFPSLEIFKELETKVPLLRTVHSFETLCETHLKLLPDGSICTFPLGKKCKTVCGLQNSFRAVRVRSENRFSKNRFSRFLAISTYIQKVLVDNGFPPEKIRVLPNFTRLKPWPTDVTEENRILYVGRMTPEKGLLQLIRAMRRMRHKPILTIVGKDGILGQSSFQDLIARELASSEIKAEIHPWLVGEELSRGYARAKVVAISSVWPEPFGLVGIEAMMHGKPVVAFDVGGVRDWLNHQETGYVVPQGDLDQYAARVDQLLDNQEFRLTMGRKARKYAAEQFTSQRYIDALLGIYMEALDESSIDRSRRLTEVCHPQCGAGISVERSSGSWARDSCSGPQ